MQTHDTGEAGAGRLNSGTEPAAYKRELQARGKVRGNECKSKPEHAQGANCGKSTPSAQGAGGRGLGVMVKAAECRASPHHLVFISSTFQKLLPSPRGHRNTRPFSEGRQGATAPHRATWAGSARWWYLRSHPKRPGWPWAAVPSGGEERPASTGETPARTRARL